MKKTLLFLYFFSWLIGAEGTLDLAKKPDMISQELAMLDSLIDVTKQNLKNELTIKKLITDYAALQEEYLKGEENQELLFKVVLQAHRIQEKIEASHLTETFSPEFLEEIKLFTQTAAKRGVPKP